jgi:hypothetical protein
MSQLPFRPAVNQTVNINVSSSSQNVQVTASSGMQQVRVMNNGTATVWIAHGTSNAIAASLSTSMPVGPGGTEVVSGQGPMYIAAIAVGASGNVYFTPGEGI